MPTLNSAFINALLADSAYVEGLTPSTNLKRALSTRMTPALAEYIANKFSIVTQAPITLSSFDATVWRANSANGTADPSGKIYLSFRGTQQAIDFLADADLALTGNARGQVTDMVNWWLRISTPLGQMAGQISTFGPIYQPSRSVPGEGLISAADLAAGIEVNGHSLGGYLATGFTRLFGTQANVVHTNTFNSAGFAIGSEAALLLLQYLVGSEYGLGRFPSREEQTNYFAKNGLNVTANSFWFSQQGRRTELFNELAVTQVGNHSMYKLTDSLALGNALSTLDSGLTAEKLNLLLEAGSNEAKASIEGTFDSLRRLLQGKIQSPTPVGDVSDSEDSRKTYQSMLAALQENPAFKNLVGKVTINVPDLNLSHKAKDRISYDEMAALETLATVVFAPGGNEGRAALKSLWQSDPWIERYQGWLSDKQSLQVGELPHYYSDKWIDDRSILLGAIVAHNSKDGSGTAYSAGLPSDRAYELRWTDEAGEEKILFAENAGRRGGVLTRLRNVSMTLLHLAS